MDYNYGSARQLSSGALRFLNTYAISDNNRNIYVNFILQIYKCIPLLPSDLFSCSLFDKENICNKFILKYEEGKPYVGDIISITKINVSLLSDRKSKLFICEEIKLLEKGKNFLINPKNLIDISSKIKLESKNNFIPSNSTKEKKNSHSKNSKREEEKFLEFNSNNSYQKEISNIDNVSLSIMNSNFLSDKTNSNKINIDTKKNNSNKNEIKFNQKEKPIKINPIKKEELSQNEKDMIMESIDLFLDDFQDGIEEQTNSSQTQQEQNIKDKEKEKDEPKDYSLLQKRKNNIKPPKIIKVKKNQKEKFEIQFKYISEINRILFGFQNMECNFQFKIKCHIDKFDLGKNIFYMGCSLCKKSIKTKDKICCMGCSAIPLYSFHLIVKDPTGKCKLFFNDKQGSKLMGIPAEKFRNYLYDKTPIGDMIFTTYKNDFFDNEYMIYLEFVDDLKNKNKKFEVINVERIGKKHRYEIVNELKNILVI